MDNPFVGLIIFLSGQSVPNGWALCQGQLLSPTLYADLYHIIGTTFGGNGTTTFALPDLRNRVPVGVGSGPGLPAISRGQQGGTATHTLTTGELPAHTHALKALAEAGNNHLPTGNFLANTSELDPEYRASGTPVSMHASAIGQTGGGVAHNKMQPYLGINYAMALVGILPTE